MTASSTIPIPPMRADWTPSGACTSGSTEPPRGATRRASGGAATTSTGRFLRTPARVATQRMRRREPCPYGPKVNYHLGTLETHGLVHVASERRWGGLTERLLVATASSFVVSPSALGPVAAAPIKRWISCLRAISLPLPPASCLRLAILTAAPTWQ